MFSKTINILLAAYLVLFLNFGPSYHCAFVDHNGCCGSHSHAAQVDHHSGCACQDPTEGQSDSKADSSVDEEHECSLCDFFDQLHLTMEFQTVEVQVRQQSLDVIPIELSRQSPSIDSQARGPPAFFFTA